VLRTTTFSHRTVDGQLVTSVSAVDDGYGNIDLITTDENGINSIVYPQIGTINYSTGEVSFKSSFAPVTSSTLFTVTVEPQNNDIFVFENKILRVSRGYSDSVRVSLQTQTTRKQNIRG
jgi:hypothetical protein